MIIIMIIDQHYHDHDHHCHQEEWSLISIIMIMIIIIIMTWSSWYKLPGNLTQTFSSGWFLAGGECRCWTCADLHCQRVFIYQMFCLHLSDVCGKPPLSFFLFWQIILYLIQKVPKKMNTIAITLLVKTPHPVFGIEPFGRGWLTAGSQCSNWNIVISDCYHGGLLSWLEIIMKLKVKSWKHVFVFFTHL